MIDLASEKVFPLADGPKHLPRRRGNRAVHPVKNLFERGLSRHRRWLSPLGRFESRQPDAFGA